MELHYYLIWTYDINDDYELDGKWTLHRPRTTKREAIQLIRDLERAGYDREVSVCIERGSHQWPKLKN